MELAASSSRCRNGSGGTRPAPSPCPVVLLAHALAPPYGVEAGRGGSSSSTTSLDGQAAVVEVAGGDRGLQTVQFKPHWATPSDGLRPSLSTPLTSSSSSSIFSPAGLAGLAHWEARLVVSGSPNKTTCSTTGQLGAVVGVGVTVPLSRGSKARRRI